MQDMTLEHNRIQIQRRPECVPTEAELRQWATSEWIEYQAWLFHHGFVSLHDWFSLRAQAHSWGERNCPLISVITPVYNTPPEILRECIYSVQTQAYPHWELCLVDDASTRPETAQVMREAIEKDPRVRLVTNSENRGICGATNQAVEMTRGEYIAFLDHDDRLSPDALFCVAKSLLIDDSIDIVYSDRDMLSPAGLRIMHLMKPDWSPETLLSGNYLFHLVVYRRALLLELGGVREAFEGSQDYDLVLRAAEHHPNVAHIERVLYHWRQHKHSLALQHDAKEYVFSAGVRALEETLKRRGLAGRVEENEALWRGNYRVLLSPPHRTQRHLARAAHWAGFGESLKAMLREASASEYVILLGPGVEAVNTECIDELVAWLQVPGVKISTGMVRDDNDRLRHAGLVWRPDGSILEIFAGHSAREPGYMAAVASVRNVSIPHPACCAVRSDILRRYGKDLSDFSGPYALLDLAMRMLVDGSRVVYAPRAEFTAGSDWLPADSWPLHERSAFATRWQDRLKLGDPYYNRWLTLQDHDMGLAADWLQRA
jgi:glycosyltransferase involved in cell wall biosynthesis